ncbi:MAG: C40 family peptidase [Pseudomonadota bacterium]
MDSRTTPARSDIAAARLKGVVKADAYVDSKPMQVSVPLAPMTRDRDAEGEMVHQLIFGERFDAYEVDGGWAWGQAALDGYVGYIPEACLIPAMAEPTHRIDALQALVYPEPNFRARPIGALPFGARVTPGEASDQFASLDVGGWVGEQTLKPLDATADWTQTAERFLGAPYLWGGRSAAGFDCSGLVQVALQAAGRECPRDSDQQMALGEDVKSPERGDLIFWKGHVGILVSAKTLLHANLHHMAVAKEPLAAAIKRIAKKEFGEVLAIRRLAQ